MFINRYILYLVVFFMYNCIVNVSHAIYKAIFKAIFKDIALYFIEENRVCYIGPTLLLFISKKKRLEL